MSWKPCPKCQRSGFDLIKGQTRPAFKCLSCGHIWTSGATGRPYFKGAENVGNTRPLDWVEDKSNV